MTTHVEPRDLSSYFKHLETAAAAKKAPAKKAGKAKTPATKTSPSVLDEDEEHHASLLKTPASSAGKTGQFSLSEHDGVFIVEHGKKKWAFAQGKYKNPSKAAHAFMNLHSAAKDAKAAGRTAKQEAGASTPEADAFLKA
jgi:hypothetical protein